MNPYEPIKNEHVEKLTELGNNSVVNSFTITYALMITTGTITFIEAIRTNDVFVRHVMNLETCISIVAAYFYSLFIKTISEQKSESKTEDTKYDWKSITRTRYIDWMITTPMMLLALCLVLSRNSQTIIKFFVYLSIIALNYIMLYLGYLGEINIISKISATLYGFVAFFAMYFIIFKQYVMPKYNFSNYLIFGLYFIIWSCYGVVYLMEEEYKNIFTNILDLTAKCLIGLGLWVYFTRIIRV